jgi:hypothetical protein
VSTGSTRGVQTCVHWKHKRSADVCPLEARRGVQTYVHWKHKRSADVSTGSTKRSADVCPLEAGREECRRVFDHFNRTFPILLFATLHTSLTLITIYWQCKSCSCKIIVYFLVPLKQFRQISV